jgi:hypothetical protein
LSGIIMPMSSVKNLLFMRFNRSVLLLAILLIAVFSFGTGYLFFYHYPSLKTLEEGNAIGISEKKFVSALDGSAVNSIAGVAPRIVAVMIDNHPDARPGFGLSKAKVVYEAPVEGGFTRYMAIFNSKQTIDKVGSVRSARPYFLDWAQEYGNALYMHSGGSPEALALIKTRGISDANEFYWGNYFWRAADKDAPHDLYSKSDNWLKIMDKTGSSSTFAASAGWKFAKLIGGSLAEKKEIKITYNYTYEVMWKYDSKALNFVRYVNGEQQLDGDGLEVRASNILVQYTGVRVIDEVGRKKIDTIGTGSALILRKGEAMEGSWKKTTLAGRTRFYNKQNRETVLIPGNTWVEIVPEDAKVEITN